MLFRRSVLAIPAAFIAGCAGSGDAQADAVQLQFSESAPQVMLDFDQICSEALDSPILAEKVAIELGWANNPDIAFRSVPRVIGSQQQFEKQFGENRAVAVIIDTANELVSSGACFVSMSFGSTKIDPLIEKSILEAKVSDALAGDSYSSGPVSPWGVTARYTTQTSPRYASVSLQYYQINTFSTVVMNMTSIRANQNS